MDKNIPSWSEYFMKLSKTASIRSKDPYTKVGSVIVDSNNRVLSIAYNGFAPGAEETAKLWKRPEKYKHVRHAEENAIRHLTKDAEGCTLYTTMFPCEACSRIIFQAGIKKVIYQDNKYDNPESRRILGWGNIEIIQMKKISVLQKIGMKILKIWSLFSILMVFPVLLKKIIFIVGKKN